MHYDLQRDRNTGNWWIIYQDEAGYRKIVHTLSADLSRVEARIYMENYIKENDNG